MDEKQKVAEVVNKLAGYEYTSLKKFDEEGRTSCHGDYADRDLYVHNKIITFFKSCGMEEDDLFVFADEFERNTIDGWSVCYLDEGISLFKDGERLGSVCWCYRGGMGDCWVESE